MNIQKLPVSDIPALSEPYEHLEKIGPYCVNLLLLTVPGVAGVMDNVIDQVLRWGAIPSDNITFDVDELSRLDRIEQAQCLEEAERQINEVQSAAANDENPVNRVGQQRQYLVDTQHLILKYLPNTNLP